MKRPPYDWDIGKPLPLLGKHSVAKHEIFEQYIGIYIDHLTRSPAQTMLNLTIVDGFCGGGLYRLGKGKADGSPLRLLRAVEQAQRLLNAARIKGFQIRADFFFVDDNPKHIAFLHDLLLRQGYGSRLGKDIFLQTSTFEGACPSIIQHIQKKGWAHRALFFLDQYGWSDVRMATVRKIMASLNNPEVLLTFAVDSLIDFLSEKTAESRALLDIELDREDVRALMQLTDGSGWRYLIQNGLYRHIKARTDAGFYTPFFIHSPESHRSYWLLHLSHHREARDEMGKLHWRITNHFQHHGEAGFHALGFDPRQDLRQQPMGFMFDDDARARSEAAVIEQIPRLLRASPMGPDAGLEVHDLFAARCNDTPVTSEILGKQILELRDAGELTIVSDQGAIKPRARKIDWGDRLFLSPQRTFFSKLFLQP